MGALCSVETSEEIDDARRVQKYNSSVVVPKVSQKQMKTPSRSLCPACHPELLGPAWQIKSSGADAGASLETQIPSDEAEAEKPVGALFQCSFHAS